MSDAFQSKVQRFNPEQEMFEDIPDLAVRKQKKESSTSFSPFFNKKIQMSVNVESNSVGRVESSVLFWKCFV